ncbi:unnamed protein product [Symbiodinium natans]|uniref:Uncharacterized protein n=1 Tax=Symbiodinium natans TaxID=878477 RepID=A0A812JKE6_9DINO|nr:unnamed protein product [Symbiodinium natans]
MGFLSAFSAAADSAAKYFSESLVCRVLSNVEEKRAAVKQEAHKEQQSEDTAVTSFQSRSVRELLILPRRRCFLSLATFVEVHGSFFQLSEKRAGVKQEACKEQQSEEKRAGVKQEAHKEQESEEKPRKAEHEEAKRMEQASKRATEERQWPERKLKETGAEKEMVEKSKEPCEGQSLRPTGSKTSKAPKAKSKAKGRAHAKVAEKGGQVVTSSKSSREEVQPQSPIQRLPSPQ